MTPEEIEIDQKQQLILQLEEQLADLDAEYAHMCLDVERFQQRYLDILRPLYARLDRWNLRVACSRLVIDRLREVRDGMRPLPEDPFEWSAQSVEEARREWNDQHVQISNEFVEEVEHLPESVHQSAKEMYRILARRYHPDLVNDEETRTLRTEMMTEINNAYQKQDLIALQELLHRPPIVEPEMETLGDTLVRLIRRIAHLQALIQKSRKRLIEEKEGELVQLCIQCH